MSITPQFLDELRDKVSLAEIVGSYVSWDQKKSQPGKGDYWAPCPFHQEKTASFHVEDRKGFYYCFGCHAKGDAIGFLKDHANMGFVDAVRTLADKAGVPMPEQSPQAAEAQSRNSKLIEITEQAARYFQRNLQTSAGAGARDYLAGRGLDDDTISNAGLGFAPNARNGLIDYLSGQGIAQKDMAEAGLAVFPDDNRSPYDRFRDRIIFPIRDGRGRTIAFGGRAMQKDAQAKYLNSPETPIFHKSNVLYNLDRARSSVDETTQLIVCEGYMDVIAMVKAGFTSAVAPLGTAITEHQLQAMWLLSPEPVLALDGDTAGIRAAHRAADLALPLISAGRSLRFVLMPDGQDPDDLLRTEGTPGMRARLDAATPLARLLWDREVALATLDTPERRAGFDARLGKILSNIGDENLRGHYKAQFKNWRDELFAPAKPASRMPASGSYKNTPNGRRNGNKNPQAQTSATRANLAAILGQHYVERDKRVALILKCALNHQAVRQRYLTQIAMLTATAPALESVRKEVIATISASTTIQHEDKVKSVADALDRFGLAHICGFAGPHGDVTQALRAVGDELAKIRAQDGLESELRDARLDMDDAEEERATYRILQALQDRENALRQTGRDDEATDNPSELSELEKLRQRAGNLKKG